MTDEQRKKDEAALFSQEAFAFAQKLWKEEFMPRCKFDPSDELAGMFAMGVFHALSHARSEHTEEMREAVSLLTRVMNETEDWLYGSVFKIIREDIEAFISKHGGDV